MQVAVNGNQVRIPAGFKLAILIYNNILSVFTGHITGAGCLHGNIALFGRGLAVNDDLAGLGFQFHISFGRHGLCIRIVVVSDMDIAVYALHAYIRISRFYRS